MHTKNTDRAEPQNMAEEKRSVCVCARLGCSTSHMFSQHMKINVRIMGTICEYTLPWLVAINITGAPCAENGCRRAEKEASTGSSSSR